MGILSSLVKGAFSPLSNGVAAGRAAPIIARITGKQCDTKQLNSLKWWAERNGQRKYVWNRFEYAFHQLHIDYLSNSSNVYSQTPYLREKILAEYADFREKDLISDAHIINLYEKLMRYLTSEREHEAPTLPPTPEGRTDIATSKYSERSAADKPLASLPPRATDHERRSIPTGITEKSDRAIHGRTESSQKRPIRGEHTKDAIATPRMPQPLPKAREVPKQSQLELEAVLIQPDGWTISPNGKSLNNAKTGEHLLVSDGLGFSVGKLHYILHNRAVNRKISIEDLLLEQQTRPDA